MSSLLTTFHELFPLTRILSKNIIDKPPRPQQILLSQIPDIDKEVIALLESSGIYDTADYFNSREHAQSRIPAYILEELDELLESFNPENSARPKILLNFPRNFAFLSLAKDQSTNALGIYWNDVLIILSNPIEEGWNLVKFAFERLYERMGRPELIGSYAIHHDWPTWMSELVDVSIYLKIPHHKTVSEYAQEWGFPPVTRNEAWLHARHNCLSLAYLHVLATNQVKIKVEV